MQPCCRYHATRGLAGTDGRAYRTFATIVAGYRKYLRTCPMSYTEKGSAVYIPAGAAQTEIEIRKSRFIAIALATDSAEDAREEIKAAWQKHPQASHIVYAYQIGKRGDLFGLSDDGEPHGTAGRPVLEVVKGSGISNLLVMVIRYFGGTKLGTGGLVKAYTLAAQELLAVLATEELIQKRRFFISLPYPLYEPVHKLLRSHGAEIEGEDFLTEVSLSGNLPQSETDTVQHALLELSAGELELEFIEENYIHYSASGNRHKKSHHSS